MKTTWRLLLAAGACAALLGALAGCGKNGPATLLTPTGIRPAPETWPGSLTGLVLFDPVNAPRLGSAPYPPTRVELLRGSELIAVDSIGGDSRTFRFDNLPQGTYGVVARSTAFLPNSRGNLAVRDGELDMGNLTLTVTASTDSIPGFAYVIGSMPGYDDSAIGMFTTVADPGPLGQLGVIAFPGDFSPTPLPVPAGTYRFKFVLDESSTNGNLIGLGWIASDTLTVPVTEHPFVRGRGPASDIVARFPSAGSFQFKVDALRQTFSITPLPPAPSARARRVP